MYGLWSGYAKSAFLKIFGFFPALLYETKPGKR